MKKLEFMTEPELKHVMNTLCLRVEDGAVLLGVEKPLFVLLLFNDPKIAQYASNCKREDIIKALKEAAYRLENKQDVERK